MFSIVIKFEVYVNCLTSCVRFEHNIRRSNEICEPKSVVSARTALRCTTRGLRELQCFSVSLVFPTLFRFRTECLPLLKTQ